MRAQSEYFEAGMTPPEIHYTFGLDDTKAVKDEGMKIWKSIGM
jgi:hypothetical protein